MTISSTRTREFSIATIVKHACRRAQLINVLQEPGTVQATAAREMLDIILDSLQTKGLFARTITLELVQLTAGVFEYTLPPEFFDVISDGMYIAASEPDPTRPTAAMLVSQKDRDTRQTIGAEAATGIPSIFYTDRTVAPLKVWLWPTPNEAGRIRFQVHRLIADSTNAGNTADVERFWVDYLIWELAYRLAVDNGINASTVLLLKGEAREKLDSARAYAMPRGSIQFYVDHPTAWSR